MGQANFANVAIVAFEDEDDAELASLLLEESGYRVLLAPDPEDLLSHLEAEAMDVAVLFADPETIPPATLGSIRKSWPWVRVVTTAPAEEDDRPRRPGTLRREWRPLDLLIVAEQLRSGRETMH